MCEKINFQVVFFSFSVLCCVQVFRFYLCHLCLISLRVPVVVVLLWTVAFLLPCFSLSSLCMISTHTHTHSIILLLFIYYKQSSVTCAVGTALQPMGFATEGRPVPERARAPPGLSFLVEAGGEREEGGARTRSQSAPNTPAPPPLCPPSPPPPPPSRSSSSSTALEISFWERALLHWGEKCQREMILYFR